MRYQTSKGSKQTSAKPLLVSGLLNLALAGFLGWLLFERTPQPLLTPRVSQNVADRTQPEQTNATQLPAILNYVTNRFHWQQIESTHYEQYVANLRAIGCPEKTICDIIVPDLRIRYRSERAALVRTVPFWQAGKQRRLSDVLQAAKLEKLEDEELAVIQQLLNVNPWEVRERLLGGGDFEGQAVVRFLLGPMPEESFQRVISLLQKNDALRTRIQQHADGIMTDEDRAEVRELEAGIEQEFRAAATREQFEEMMARQEALKIFDRGILTEVMDLAPTEARQMALARARIDESLKVFEWFNGFGSSTPESDDLARERQFTNAVAGILGEKRFAEYVRAGDDEFQKLFSLGKDKGLSREAAVTVYEIQRYTKEEVERVRNDSSLDDTVRRQRLDEMQAVVQARVIEALGKAGYSEYLSRGATWVTNLTNL